MKLPPRDRPIRLVGLTGNIGTGKTTAAKAFARLGIRVIDADQIARQVVAPGTAGLTAVITAFGPEILTTEGSLDRDKLSKIVFSDQSARNKLETLIHPLVAVETDKQLAMILGHDPETFAVYDVPLLFETGIDAKMDLTVVVTAEREAQISRVIERSGLTREEIDSRIQAQMELREKVRRADIELPNDTTVKNLAERIAELTALIRTHNKAFTKNVDKRSKEII